MGLLLAFQHYISYIYISIPYVTAQIPFKAGHCLSSPCRYEVVEGWQLPMAAHRSAGPQWALEGWGAVISGTGILKFCESSYALAHVQTAKLPQLPVNLCRIWTQFGIPWIQPLSLGPVANPTIPKLQTLMNWPPGAGSHRGKTKEKPFPGPIGPRKGWYNKPSSPNMTEKGVV